MQAIKRVLKDVTVVTEDDVLDNSDITNATHNVYTNAIQVSTVDAFQGKQ